MDIRQQITHLPLINPNQIPINLRPYLNKRSILNQNQTPRKFNLLKFNLQIDHYLQIRIQHNNPITALRIEEQPIMRTLHLIKLILRKRPHIIQNQIIAIPQPRPHYHQISIKVHPVQKNLILETGQGTDFEWTGLELVRIAELACAEVVSAECVGF